MKKPRKEKTYCPFCKKHTEHSIKKVKKKQASEFKQGQRRFRRVMKGYRGFPRPKPAGREKASRHTTLKYTCTECNKSHLRSTPRTKRLELGE